MNKFFTKIKEYLDCKDQFEICDLRFLRENKKDFIFFKNNIDEIKEEILAREPINKDSKNAPTEEQLNYLFGRGQEIVVAINGYTSKGYINHIEPNYSFEIKINRTLDFMGGLLLHDQENIHEETAFNNSCEILNYKKNIRIAFKDFLIKLAPAYSYSYDLEDDICTIIRFKDSFYESFILIGEINQLKTEEENLAERFAEAAKKNIKFKI